ncbi:MAG TPA: GDSL-type esterase/lipase family protein [Solirubrobacteraceae bacterium]
MTIPRRPRDDSLMGRFDRSDLRRFRARDGILVVLLAAVILIVFQGASIRKAGEEMNGGVGRDAVLAVGRPAGWIADRLPLASVSHSATAWLSPEPNLGGGGFQQGARGLAGSIPPVTADAFDASTIGAPAPPRRPLHTLLVTGDSMSQPLDSDLAQLLAPAGVHVIRDPHLGTGISTTFIVNWGKLAALQIKQDHPDAVVVFIGANDGFPMTGPSGREVPCCSAEWAAIYANRARQIANTYRQNGAARVYWLTLPTPREQARQSIARVVNAAIEVAVAPWADQIRVIDTVPTFTPGGVYRDSMSVGGTQTIVRQSDGIHLNEAGSSLLAGIVLAKVRQDFKY